MSGFVRDCNLSGRIRQFAGAILALLFLWPAAGSLPLTRWNLHVWKRLNAAGRDAPQTTFDRHFQAVGAFLPSSGRIGLVLLGSQRPDDAARNHYLLQYALVPRQIVLGDTADFVIAYGPASEDTTLADESTFELVRVFGDDLRLFRRVAR